MDWITEMKLSAEFQVALVLLQESLPTNEVWDWERVSFVYLHHSFLRTFAARDFSVALQSLNGDLLSGHIKAADGWNRS